MDSKIKIARALAPIGALLTLSERYITADNPLGILTQAAVLLRGEKILWVGKQDDVPADFDLTEADIVTLAGKTVLPGLIDCHTHLVFSGSRAGELDLRVEGATYLEILKAGGGIGATVRATQEASFDELYDLGMQRLSHMMQRGVTTVEAKSGYGLSPGRERRILEVIQALNRDHSLEIIPTFLGAHTIPPRYKKNPEKYVESVIQEMIPEVADKNLAVFCDVFCEEGVFNVETSRKILETARQHGLCLKIHADQLAASGGGALAAELKATSADHLEYLPEAVIPAFQDAGTVAVLLPTAGLYLMMDKIPPITSLRQQGVPLAIATDFNPGSAPCLSLLTAMTLAATMYRLPSSEIIKGVTVHAARAVGKEKTLGRVEAGYQADFAVFPVRDYALIATTFGETLPDRVMKKGKWVSLSSSTHPLMSL